MTEAPPRSTWALMKSGPFSRLWKAGLVSSTGDWVAILATLSLADELAGSGGIVLALVSRLLPGLFFAAVGGVIADRVNRKHAMVTVELGRAVLVFSLVFARNITTLVLINLAMAPFRHYSIVNGLKMAKLSPEMRAIQERYRKVPLMDPRRQQMQEEVAALYAKHGMSMGSQMMVGCLPLLLTMPFLFAFYRVLTVSVELRGAPFLWISDLAQKDPLFLTPVLMGVSMFVMQKLTPSTMDPAQQRIMMLMPLMLAGMFLLVLIAAADIGAYFGGRTFGHRKLAPRVSPNKTWEGFWSGVAAAACAAWVGGWLLGKPLLPWVGICVLVALASVMGDLVESMFKRQAGLKDSSSLLPGHGGVLDRLDSLSAAGPMFLLGLSLLGRV